MDKREMMALAGSMQQLAYVRPVEYTEGRAGGLAAWQVKNGPMAFTVMPGKCLDIAEFTYKGVGFHFLAKPGLMGRNHFDTHGDEARRGIMGGLLFTAGLGNICAPCTIHGIDWPMHGRIRTTPAEHCRADARWQGEQYVLELGGEMREAQLFGENLVLRRSIRTVYGERSMLISDEIENQSHLPEPLLLLYHFNFGYPLLGPGARVVLPSDEAVPRDEDAALHAGVWASMDAPAPGVPEQVFIHRLRADTGGCSFAAVVNPRAKLGMKLEFSREALPYFMQWKSVAAGDYALGLEPATASVFGRTFHQREGSLPMLDPFETRRFELRLTVLDGDDDLDELERTLELI